MEYSFQAAFRKHFRHFVKILRIGIKFFIVICAILWLWERIDSHLSIQDELAIDHLYIQFEGYLREGDFTSAYDFMHPDYKARRTLEGFAQRFYFVHANNDDYRLHPQRYLSIGKNRALLLPKPLLRPPSSYWLSV